MKKKVILKELYFQVTTLSNCLMNSYCGYKTIKRSPQERKKNLLQKRNRNSKKSKQKEAK